jgi:hypothetical protein
MIDVNSHSLMGIAAGFVEGQRQWVQDNERRLTNNDTGIVTVYRLTTSGAM